MKKKQKKSKKGKILPWMLASTSFLLAGTTTVTIVLSVLPSDSLSQSQSNTIDKNVNFELKHDKLRFLNDIDTKLQSSLKNINVDMDRYFFGMNLLNRDNFKFNIEEKNNLFTKLKPMFDNNKIEFINNIIDVIVLNNKNSISWNYYGINSVANKDSWQKNIVINSYKTSDVFLINGIYQMEFSIDVSQESSILKKQSNEKRFAIKFKESNDLDQKSYIEIIDKTDIQNPIVEIKEIIDIYSQYLLLNEYYNRNNLKSYLSINPFSTTNENIFENNSELSNILKKYNDYINANYFYQFMKVKSLNWNNFDIKSVFNSNKSSIDETILKNVNDLSTFIFQNSNEIKNIFTFLGIEDLSVFKFVV